MYVLHVRRFANTHFSHVNSSYNEKFCTKLRKFLQLFHCTFPVSYHSTSQTIKKQVVIQDTS